MEFRTLHYFLTVAQERNITRAAEKLHMAQPPLTRQIKRLEEELGVPLLIRGGRQLQLTEEGRFLQARGREILQLMENTQQQLGQLGPAQYGTIRLCTTEVSGATLLSERIAAFHETAPNIHFQILAGDSTENRDRLEKNLVDMGIVREPFNLEPYDQIALRREPWGILCSRDHPLAAQHPETVPLACLGEVPLMLPARQSLQADIHNWLGQFLPRRNVFCLYNSIFSILGLAQRGLGVILAPPIGVGLHRPGQLGLPHPCGAWPSVPDFLGQAPGPADAPGSGPVLGVCGGVLRSEGMKTARKGNLSWLEGSSTYVKRIMEINMLPLPLERWRGAAG